MNKILISWIAYNNDFVSEKVGTRSRRLGTINESGPTFSLHKYFWDEANYDKHILLNNNLSKDDQEDLTLFKKEMALSFKGHCVESIDIDIKDPISVSEIFSKLSPLVAGFNKYEIEVFISPGTPAMQTAWYILGTHFRKNMTLFQVRGKEYTKDKLKPEKIIVSLNNDIFPANITVAQKTLEEKKFSGDFLITKSLEPIYKRAASVAMTNDVGCLILGENGTGKENLARYIHENSNRHDKPFVAVNCAAYTDELLVSELFGHEKGSFTGADNKKIGVFEAAQGGTVFLDEIGDISPKMQSTLLRVLQEKTFQRIGSVKEIKTDIRVISATNKDIEMLCEQDRFRMDLFYRLAVTDLKLPPLRERGKDEVLLLIDHFNERFSKKFPSKIKLKISKDVIDYLAGYGFNGNVRELENMFVHFYTFCDGEIKVEDMPERVKKNRITSLKLADVEKRHIVNIFNINKQNILVTSKILDLHRDTLKRKLKEYGILR